MVHRDLKPPNLMLTTDGVVKILDFGLARFASEQAESTDGLTQASTMMGTPDFMAPEQAMDARRADIRADIYSLGCALYCLLTGRPPFPNGTAMEKMAAHLQSTPPSLTEFGVPAAVDAVVARMMAKDPGQRFPIAHGSGRGAGVLRLRHASVVVAGRGGRFRGGDAQAPPRSGASRCDTSHTTSTQAMGFPGCRRRLPGSGRRRHCRLERIS